MYTSEHQLAVISAHSTNSFQGRNPQNAAEEKLGVSSKNFEILYGPSALC